MTAGAISPDGTLLAYSDRKGVPLRELGGAAFLAVTGPGRCKDIEWFPDGHHILVSATASSTQRPQIWSLSTGDEVPRLVRDGANWASRRRMDRALPQLSPDGRWVLFASNLRWSSGEPYTLYRVPEAGGSPVKVEIGGPLDEYRCPLLGKICILRETEEHKAFHYYALDPVAGKGRLLCSTPCTESLLWDWSVSADGTKIALPLLDPAKPRIRVVPCPGSRTTSVQEIPVKIERHLREVVWAADSQGWFVSTESVPKGADLFYVRLNGVAAFLRHDDLLWAVPSPDGRKLAFVGETAESNVWLLR